VATGNVTNQFTYCSVEDAGVIDAPEVAVVIVNDFVNNTASIVSVKMPTTTTTTTTTTTVVVVLVVVVVVVVVAATATTTTTIIYLFNKFNFNFLFVYISSAYNRTITRRGQCVYYTSATLQVSRRN